MSDIGTMLASCVIFLFSENGISPLGTAFIVGYPTPNNQKEFIPIVVTAKHVIANQSKIVGRFTSKEGKTLFINYDLTKIKSDGDLWEDENDNGLDIVAFRTEAPTDADFATFPIADIASRDDFKTEEIKATDRIIFPSLLLNFTGTTKNYPVIRDGTIALIPDTKIDMKFKSGGQLIQTSQEIILLNAASFPGASGSPVFLFPGMRIKNRAINTGGGKALLLGVMHGFYPAQEKEVNEHDVTKAKYSYSENSGIAVMFPSYRIRELLEGNKIKQRIDKLLNHHH